MAERIDLRHASDDELGRALSALATRLEHPPADPIAPQVRRRLVEEASVGRPRAVFLPSLRAGWRVAVAAALAVVVLLAGILVFSSGARRAVAGWLGLEGAHIVITPKPPPASLKPLGAGLDLGHRVTPRQAVAGVPYPILVAHDSSLGRPAVYVDRHLGDPQVSFVYPARPGLPKAATTGAGLLLTELRSGLDRGFLEKFLFGTNRHLRPVRIGRDRGFWVFGGLHDIQYVDANGVPVQDTRRLAGNSLLWQHGDVTLRIEGKVSLRRALAIARTVR